MRAAGAAAARLTNPEEPRSAQYWADKPYIRERQRRHAVWARPHNNWCSNHQPFVSRTHHLPHLHDASGHGPFWKSDPAALPYWPSPVSQRPPHGTRCLLLTAASPLTASAGQTPSKGALTGALCQIHSRLDQPRQRARRIGIAALAHPSRQIRHPPCLNGGFHGSGHQDRVTRFGNRGVHQHAVAAKLHRD